MPAVDRYRPGGRGATQPAQTRFSWRSGTLRAAGWPVDAYGPDPSALSTITSAGACSVASPPVTTAPFHTRHTEIPTTVGVGGVINGRRRAPAPSRTGTTLMVIARRA